ncbi:MAG: hypothetical protein WCT14_10325 [Treponemataceae bacterium]
MKTMLKGIHGSDDLGRDIGVWRDLVKNPDLDAIAGKSVAFVRSHLR